MPGCLFNKLSFCLTDFFCSHRFFFPFQEFSSGLTGFLSVLQIFFLSQRFSSSLTGFQTLVDGACHLSEALITFRKSKDLCIGTSQIRAKFRWRDFPHLCACIRALKPSPFLQLLVKFVMLTPGYLEYRTEYYIYMEITIPDKTQLKRSLSH